MLKDVQFRFEPFPCPIDKVNARLDIYPDKSWRISQFRGEHRGAQLTGQAWMVGTLAGDVIHIDMIAKQMSFTSELFAALPEEVQTVWKHFKPGGKADAKVTFDKLEKGKPNVDVTITARGATIFPDCFKYQLNNLQGTVHYANKEVEVGCLTAEHGGTNITIDGGHVTLRPGAGFLVQMTGINFDQIPVDDDLLNALPVMLRDSVATLKPDKPLKLRLNLDVDQPGESKQIKLGWSGSVEFNECGLHCGLPLEKVTGVLLLENGEYDERKLDCRGQLYVRSMNVAGKQEIGPFHSKMLLTKNELQLHECQAKVPGGSVMGLIEVKFGGAPRFHVNLNGDVRLEEMLKQQEQLKGRVRGNIQLNGEGGNLRNLSGAGTILVDQGAHLYRLPLVIDIFNQFSQMMPKATNFQTAKLDFIVKGDQVEATQLQLLGDAYRIEGSGTAKVDGTDLNLVLTLVMGGGRTLPLMPAMLDTLQKTIAKGLVKVRVNGTVNKVEVHVEPLPFIVEPFREVIKATGGR
ncbi:MAG: AsmA-like C-terminal region-containing protein [Gemmatales bacterium]